MTMLNVLAGIAWDPTIRGILTVVLGFSILGGSVYLIVATNTGARLGLLISLAGLFGWMVILTLFWWISPPGIGPAGDGPSWVPIEVYVDGEAPPENAQAQELPHPDELPTGTDIVAENPELAAELVSDTPSLSDVAGVDPDAVPGRDELNGWKLVGTSDAGEAQAAADAFLVEAGVFDDATQYIKLDTFEIGGKPKRTEECDDDDALCRAWYRIRKSFMLTHPPHYAVVQLQPVLEQETLPGAAPPTPVVDESQPVVSVVLVRDLGSRRLTPAIYFVICLSLFIVFVLILHYRDKTLTKNLEAAKAVQKAGP